MNISIKPTSLVKQTQFKLFAKYILSIVLLLFSFITLSEPTVFGDKGTQGGKGRDGLQGTMDGTKHVFADGSKLSIDVSGNDGKPGKPGDAGSTAKNCSVAKLLMHDLKGAKGGKGGKGGDGGNGGNGSNLYIYYKNKNALKNLRVITGAGIGGHGGVPGRCGKGCPCQVLEWENRACRKTTRQQIESDKNKSKNDVKICSPAYFRCTSGLNGADGRHGHQGTLGKPGKIYLIKHFRKIHTNQSKVTIAFKDISRNIYQLSKSTWQKKHGIRKYFSKSSITPDTAYEFTNFKRWRYRFIWASARPLDSVPGHVKLMINNSASGQSKLLRIFPVNLWVKSTISKNKTFITETISDIVDDKEAEKLSATLIDYGTDTKLVLTDSSPQYQKFKTRVYLKLKVGQYFGAKTVYENLIPVDAMTADTNKIGRASCRERV